MKLNGKPLDAPKEVTLVLPRESGEIVFIFRAIMDESEFKKLRPEPVPPKKIVKGQKEPIEDVTDATYLKLVDEWREDQVTWQFLTSISATPGIEWEKVQLNDYTTWKLWKDELKDSGLTLHERNLVFSSFVDANMLNNNMLKEARDRFLSMKAAQQAQDSI